MSNSLMHSRNNSQCLEFLACTPKIMPPSYRKALFAIPVRKVDMNVEVLGGGGGRSENDTGHKSDLCLSVSALCVDAFVEAEKACLSDVI